MRKKYMASILVAVVAISLRPSLAGAHPEQVIFITNRGFVPEEITIERGETVTFINEDSTEHWVASDSHPTHTNYPGSDIRNCGEKPDTQILDSCRGMAENEKFTFTFEKSGVWGIHDHLNSDLTAKIHVEVGVGEEENAKNGRAKSEGLSIWKRLSAWTLKQWYSIFENMGEQQLNDLDINMVLRDNSSIEYWMRVFGYERFFSEVEKGSLDPTLQKRDATDSIFFGQCHLGAHFAGRVAQKLFNLSAMDEVDLDTRCQLGFYHGILESSIGDIGNDENARKFANSCAKYKGDGSVRGSFCRHGLGHGLVIYHNYNLPAAVERCYELFSTGRERRHCYHGTFMENVLVSLGMGVSNHATLWIDKDDPDFPCNSDLFRNDLSVKEACYFNQPFIWGQKSSGGQSFPSLNNFDFDQAIQGCLRAPSPVRSFCFNGLGFAMATPQVSLTDEQLSKNCMSSPTSNDQRDCLAGANFMRSAVWGKSFDGLKNETLCKAVGLIDLDECDSSMRRAYRL